MMNLKPEGGEAGGIRSKSSLAQVAIHTLTLTRTNTDYVASITAQEPSWCRKTNPYA